jgi:hypothetical protein
LRCIIKEAEDKKEKKIVRYLIDFYHPQGLKMGGGGRKTKYLMYMCTNSENEDNAKYYITSVAWLHDNTPFRFIAEKYNIPNDRSYFIRRITSTCPGNYIVNFLNDLSEKLKNDGQEVLWTLGFPDHSNATYRRAGFEEIGISKNSGHPIYVKYLQKSK